MKRFGGGLVFKAHRLLYHSTLGLRVTKKKKRRGIGPVCSCVCYSRLECCAAFDPRSFGCDQHVPATKCNTHWNQTCNFESICAVNFVRRSAPECRAALHQICLQSKHGRNLIAASVYDKHAPATRLTTHMDHTSNN